MPVLRQTFCRVIFVVAFTDASQLGVLRSGVSVPTNGEALSVVASSDATSSGNRALLNENFQAVYRQLVAYGSPIASSMEQLDRNIPRNRLPGEFPNAASFSMAYLSLSMFSLSIHYGHASIETRTDPKDGISSSEDTPDTNPPSTRKSKGTNAQGESSIRDSTLQSGHGQRATIASVTSIGLLVVAGVVLHRMRRSMSLSENFGDELAAPSAVFA